MKFAKKLCYLTLSMTTCHAAMASGADILGPVLEIEQGLMEGYLHGEPPLNSAEFVPAPPTENSARQLADTAASEALRGLEGSARWDLAAKDADLHFPAAASIFSCALGAMSAQSKPRALPVAAALAHRFGAGDLPRKKPTKGRDLSSQRRIDLYA